MNNEKTISFTSPVNFNDKVYEEITVREPTVNEYMLSLKSKGNRESFEADAMVQIELLSRVSGLPVNAIESFPSSVMDEATNFIASFQEDQENTDSNEIIIDPPITISNGNEYDRLTLLEPTVGQRKKATRMLDKYGNTPLGAMEFQLSLLKDISDWPLVALLKLPISTFLQASRYLSDFFTDGQKTGKN